MFSWTYFDLFFFFFNDPATTEIYTLSLHDALPICVRRGGLSPRRAGRRVSVDARPSERDRKSTRLNSSHSQISYAVFCLKKKKRTRYIWTLLSYMQSNFDTNSLPHHTHRTLLTVHV